MPFGGGGGCGKGEAGGTSLATKKSSESTAALPSTRPPSPLTFPFLFCVRSLSLPSLCVKGPLSSRAERRLPPYTPASLPTGGQRLERRQAAAQQHRVPPPPPLQQPTEKKREREGSPTFSFPARPASAPTLSVPLFFMSSTRYEIGRYDFVCSVEVMPGRDRGRERKAGEAGSSHQPAARPAWGCARHRRRPLLSHSFTPSSQAVDGVPPGYDCVRVAWTRPRRHRAASGPLVVEHGEMGGGGARGQGGGRARAGQARAPLQPTELSPSPLPFSPPIRLCRRRRRPRPRRPTPAPPAHHPP